jgi:hypothetical protein
MIKWKRSLDIYMIQSFCVVQKIYPRILLPKNIMKLINPPETCATEDERPLLGKCEERTRSAGLDPRDEIISILWPYDELQDAVLEVAGDELNINRGTGVCVEIVLTLILILVGNVCRRWGYFGAEREQLYYA